MAFESVGEIMMRMGIEEIARLQVENMRLHITAAQAVAELRGQVYHVPIGHEQLELPLMDSVPSRQLPLFGEECV
jgi:hypothetical protein